MDGIVLHCKHDPDDRIRVERDSDGEIAFRSPGTSIYATDDAARDFARALLTLVGDEAETADVKVGDRVEITKYRDYDRGHVGKFGTVTEIDTDSIPFLVHADGYGGVWAMEVRKVTAATPSRSAALDEARRIAGPDASAADVLAYAKFLSE